MAVGLALSACSEPLPEPAKRDRFFVEEEARLARAKAVPVSRPAEFSPDVDPLTITGICFETIYSDAYKAFDQDAITSPTKFGGSILKPVRSALRALRKGSGKEPHIDYEYGECQPTTTTATYLATISLPTQTTYELILTVTVGSASGTWTIKRPFDALNDEHPQGERPLVSFVRASIHNDFRLFAREACEAITNSQCESR